MYTDFMMVFYVEVLFDNHIRLYFKHKESRECLIFVFTPELQRPQACMQMFLYSKNKLNYFEFSRPPLPSPPPNTHTIKIRQQFIFLYFFSLQAPRQCFPGW